MQQASWLCRVRGMPTAPSSAADGTGTTLQKQQGWGTDPQEVQTQRSHTAEIVDLGHQPQARKPTCFLCQQKHASAGRQTVKTTTATDMLPTVDNCHYIATTCLWCQQETQCAKHHPANNKACQEVGVTAPLSPEQQRQRQQEAIHGRVRQCAPKSKLPAR